MRIIAGKYRGKKLYSPQGSDVRPTSERAREAIFNILYSHFGGDYSDLYIADIFAGTGAFGFEALSRNFKQITFVDINPASVQKNAQLFTAEKEKISIIKADATHLPKAKQKFHIVFMDAPYAQNLTENVLRELIYQDWLHPQAICIVETRKDEQLNYGKDFKLIDERLYGIARISFLQLK